MSLIITARDVKAAGYCIIPGLKTWAEQHGYDFKEIVKNGIPAEDVETMDDAFAKRVLAKAKERVNE
jgi:hypothetical protein